MDDFEDNVSLSLLERHQTHGKGKIDQSIGANQSFTLVTIRIGVTDKEYRSSDKKWLGKGEACETEPWYDGGYERACVSMKGCSEQAMPLIFVI